MDDILKYVRDNSLKLIVKPNAKKTEIISYDSDKKALRVAVASPADENKANIEVIKFFSKLLKKPVRIKIGLKSKEKVLKF